MRKISNELREKIANSEFYKRCVFSNEKKCRGRNVTIEHCFIYAGRQIEDLWNLIPVCAYHHDVDEYQDIGGLEKRRNEWVAINRMTRSDEKKYPRIDWALKRSYLNSIYGKLPRFMRK